MRAQDQAVFTVTDPKKEEVAGLGGTHWGGEAGGEQLQTPDLLTRPPGPWGGGMR